MPYSMANQNKSTYMEGYITNMRKTKVKSKQVYSMALAACLVLSSSIFLSYAETEVSSYSLEYDYSDDEDLLFDHNTATSSNAFNPLMLRSARDAAEIETINITNATTNVNFKTEVETALNAGKDVTVIGSKNIHSINITIPDNRKVIWKAEIGTNAPNNDEPILTVSGGQNSVFEIADGASIRNRSPHHNTSVCSFKDRLTVNISGGEVYTSSSTPELSLIDASDDTVVKMTGGKINADNGVKTGIHCDKEVIMEGGKIFTESSGAGSYGTAISAKSIKINGGLIYGHGESAANLIKTPNEADKNIDAGAVVAFNKYAEPGRIYYLTGSVRNISVLPESTKAQWSTKGDYDNGIEVTEASKSHWLSDTSVIVGKIEGYTPLPDKVYDGISHSFTGTLNIKPDNLIGSGNITVKYANQSSGEISETAPVNAGKYTIYAVTSGTGKYSEDQIKLDEFEIHKRPVKVIIDNKTIVAGQALPEFTYRTEGLAGTETDAFNTALQLTANTDGRTPGVFDINISSSLNYKPNYTADSANAVITGKLTVTASNNNSGQGNNNQNNNNNNQNNNQNNNNNNNNNNQRGNNSGSGSGSGSGSSGRSAGIIATPGKNNDSRGSWIQDEKGWWYKNSDGSWPALKWLQIEYGTKTDWYYFNSEGYMVTGWQFINNKWYYFYENTEASFAKGSLAVSTTISGYNVNTNGEWIQ